MNNKTFTLGIDVGSSNIKLVLLDYSNNPVILDKITEKIRKRNSEMVADQLIDDILAKNNLKFQDIAYVASTGEGDMLARKRGHFYSMTTHAKGGSFLIAGAKTIIDMGALFVRAIKINNQMC